MHILCSFDAFVVLSIILGLLGSGIAIIPSKRYSAPFGRRGKWRFQIFVGYPSWSACSRRARGGDWALLGPLPRAPPQFQLAECAKHGFRVVFTIVFASVVNTVFTILCLRVCSGVQAS